jgi:hypothetical protein
MQNAVAELVRLGPLPSLVNADRNRVEKWQITLATVQRPVANDDASALARLFGPDDCFGLAWELIYLIETAPTWPLADALTNRTNAWIDVLIARAEGKRENR